MRFYHMTTEAGAVAILRDGFRDAASNYLTDLTWEGVWVSDVPVDANEGAKGDVLLAVELEVSEDDLRDYEWVEDGKAYREWLIPAEVLNRGRVSRVAQYAE